MVVLHTNYGEIRLNLFADKAPETVENFLNYAKSGFYDGTIFHRVIDGFMVQGGGFEPGMTQKSVQAPIKNEANNGVSNSIGTIAMARTPESTFSDSAILYQREQQYVFELLKRNITRLGLLRIR